MKRREFISLVGSAAVAWPVTARAQPPRRLQVVGFLSPGFPTYTGPGTSFTGLKDGLREIGYVEGETVKIEARFGHGRTETLPGFAEELVRLKVDVVVAIARPSIEAAKAATSELPIVALDLESDPVASGFVTSLAAPGGNITGLFLDLPSLAGKWLQLVREVVPDARRIAILWDANTGEYQLRVMSDAAKAMSVDLMVLEFRNAPGMESALTAGLKERPQALIQLGSPLINQLANRTADLLAKHRIPAISPFRSFSESGGVMSYGPVLSVWYRRLGRYVSTILKGAKPAALPVEQPTNFEFIVNLKVATTMGLAIPPGMLLRADEVIE
jgi:putative ABC transport system substrate-binding protein